MQEIIEINDISDVRIKEFISLRKSLVDENQVVVESKNVFKKLFSTNIKIHKVFTTLEHLDFLKQNCKDIDFPIFTANNEVMKEIVGHKIHQGMLALIDKPKYINFEDIKGNVVVLNGLTSPENVGSIVRSCAAFNINTLIIDEKTCSPFIRRCIRVSTGNLFNIKVYKTNTLVSDLIKLQTHGYKVLTTANHENAISLHKFEFPKKSAIVIGSEGFGAQQEVIDLSDEILKIDISEEVTSLNAAIAASIVFFQMAKS
ncbi:TrmH family RNA methyltransferase [Poseidonibacter antarcticus]|uniref:TrmH family RNA methyltransferase n=1 Tax=Poseidonibacter antarcticus TaxID=2478538 RepID=UPI000EF49C7A|nr:RNA methyltransferase [Poseidonibacter antarcticus]